MKGKYSVPWAFSDINKMHYQSMEVFHNISLSSLIVGVNGRHLFDLIPTVPHILNFPRQRMCPRLMDMLDCFLLFLHSDA